ncbi:hypothetical protein MTO96_014339 [Rhipicephalus appendiculatus]
MAPSYCAVKGCYSKTGGDFGIEVPKKKYLEPEAVPTLYAASAKHRDASPASVPTCKRLCCEQESRDAGTSCKSLYELPIVDPDSQVPSDSDSMIAVHMAAEKHDAQTQCCPKVASKNTHTSATINRQNLGVQAVETSTEIGCQTDVTLAAFELLEDTSQRVSTPVMISDSEEESADRTYAPSWMDSLMDRCL